MDDGVQEVQAEEVVAAGETAHETSAPAMATVERVYTGWLRLAYIFEFLLAVNVVFTLWSEIGGQGHLDLLPWYIKLICGVGLAWSVTRFTASVVEVEQFWNMRSRRWFLIISLFVVTMGGIVYYYHLHEIPADSESEDGSATSVELPHGGKLSQRI